MDTHTLIHAIIDDVAPTLTPALLAHERGPFLSYVRELLDQNEQGIALEDLCESLYEFNIAVSPATRDKIHAAALAMNIDPDKLPPIRTQRG